MNFGSPRGYLSASQIRTFKKSKEDYLKRYVYDQDTIPVWAKKYVDFGKEIHEQIENGELDILLIDCYNNFTAREKEINTKLDDIPLKGYIDAINTDERVVVDYKTSKNPKTQSEVDKNEQLTFYAVICELEFGWIPEEMIIYRIETDEDNGLYLTGKVDEIKTRRIKQQVEEYKKEIKRIWQKIGELVEKEIEGEDYLSAIK